MHLFPVKDNSWLFLESTSFNQNVFISFPTDADTVCIIQHILFGPQDQSVKICVIFEVQHLVAGQSHKEGSHSRQIHPYPVLDCIQRKQERLLTSEHTLTLEHPPQLTISYKLLCSYGSSSAGAQGMSAMKNSRGNGDRHFQIPLLLCLPATDGPRYFQLTSGKILKLHFQFFIPLKNNKTDFRYLKQNNNAESYLRLSPESEDLVQHHNKYLKFIISKRELIHFKLTR